MSYKIKTLIVFDTNSLRSTDAGEVAYSFFAFGRPFQVIEEFILEKNLNEDVHIAIPTWAIEELKDQKNRQYLDDVAKYNEVTKRLFGLPSFQKIPLPNPDFDCISYVQEKANEYLATKEIKLLEIKEQLANTILQSMMKRVMKDQNKKQPFAYAGKYKDAGFKDNIVWESLMHFEGITDYDKIIFLTKDTDFGNCHVEFKAKWNKHFALLKDENNVLVEIEKDYELYIKERAIYDFAQSEYFIGYLNDELNARSLIMIDEIEQPVREFAIMDSCNFVNRLPPNEEGIENISIGSVILVKYKWDDETKEQEVEAMTLLEDDETKQIISTEFDFELL